MSMSQVIDWFYFKVWRRTSYLGYVWVLRPSHRSRTMFLFRNKYDCDQAIRQLERMGSKRNFVVEQLYVR